MHKLRVVIPALLCVLLGTLVPALPAAGSQATGSPATGSLAEGSPVAGSPAAGSQEGGAQEGGGAEAAPTLAVTAIEVEPEQPSAETLCRLTVRVENRGDTPVTALRFEVKVGEVSLPVYRNQLFMENVVPAGTTEVRLYNFWVSETGRPAPKDGKLTVEVTLVEARRVSITTDEEGVETWDLLEPVAGLPAVGKITLPLTGGAPKAPRPAAQGG